MNAEIKGKWVEALRSGKYQQGQGKLCTRDCKYCCLGVLCEVLGYKTDPDPHRPFHTYQGQSGLLPHDARMRSEVTSKEEGLLIDLNDTDQRDFDFIATWIETHL